jgi:hypothetical protein
VTRLQSDADPVIAPFRHCVAGIHVGRMTPRPLAGEFDRVVTLATEPGTVDDRIRHHHLPISYINPEVQRLRQAAIQVRDLVNADQKVLLRSEGGRQRPGSVVMMTVLLLGGTFHDALQVTSVNGRLVTDFRFERMVKDYEDEIRASQS